ncbi:putative MFS family arabinose efflux permease [Nocardia tenerifensis]|uniref:Putative MFS family arabinose efflux permease n=1 Tax=Nocardia tenerifensis TaxID=228006 RepID=A0A318JWG4_9NOCA|nr:MFS transporter [Nocardia tenerifensis]PXX60939.1 putative MFS family arabinose efflux permease [Nocardia tenerifensis]
MSLSTDLPVDPAEKAQPFDWFRTLSAKGKKAFLGAFGGYGLDAYDFQVLPLALGAISSYFVISSGKAGLLTTVTLLVSALGGALAGVLADKIGRVRTLQLTVATYTLFTVLCGFAPNFETLLVFRAFQGLGFGGEWAAGAILVAEYAQTKYRGRTVAYVQSAWAVGWGLAVLVYTLVFQFISEDLAWRVLFWTGALPALLIIWVRRNLTDSESVTQRRESAGKRAGSFASIFRRDLLPTTLFASLLATGVQGGYYTLATWLPTYLKKSRHLNVVGTGGYLFMLIGGAFLGYVTGGILADRIGRKRTIQLFAALSVAFMIAYIQVPEGADTTVLILGFPLGFCTAAIFSSFGSFLSELYPTASRGTGQGFTYNFGRGVGAIFPTVVGFLASTTLGLAGAMMFGAFGYVLAVIALFGLPETRGRELA